MTDASGSHTTFRTCPLCEATCGLELQFEGDRLDRVRGDRDDVFSHGFICPKGTTLRQLHDDPDRLRRPQVRSGDRWHEVSWEDAFAAVAVGLEPHLTGDRSALAAYIGNPNAHTLAGSLYLKPLLKGLGTRNLFSASTVDQMPKHVSSGLLFGGPTLIPVPDLDRTDHLLLLGADPLESNGSLATAPDFPGRLAAMRARGGRLVVVDPRRSKTAELADEHIPIRPGADAFLLAAMAHTLVAEGLVAPGRLAAHVTGLDAIGPLLASFSPEAVASATGIDPVTIRRLARDLAAAPTAAVYGRIGTSTVEFGTLASWLVDVLNILTGNLDRPGGAMFPMGAVSRVRTAPGGRGLRTGRWASRVGRHPEVLGELPAAAMAGEMETPGPGQVRALVTVAGNPVLSTPDSRRLDAALADLDFMVSVDIYRNETTRHANVILPPPSVLEKVHYDVNFYNLSVRNIANWSPAALDPPADALHEWEILLTLALIVSGQAWDPAAVAAADDAMALHLLTNAVGTAGSPAAGAYVDVVLAGLARAGRRGPARLIDVMLRSGPYGDGFGARPDGLSLAVLEANPHGVDLGPLQPRIPEVLETPSGTIELTPAPIVADLARLEAGLDRARAGGLVLVGRRQLRSNNSWMHNVEVLVKGKERCTLLVHPDDAGRLGLVDGGTATVTSRVGSVEAPVEVTDAMMTGVVSLPHGWGHGLPGTDMAVAASRPGVNTNVLTDGSLLDPLSGNAVLNGIPVEVVPSAQPAAAAADLAAAPV